MLSGDASADQLAALLPAAATRATADVAAAPTPGSRRCRPARRARPRRHPPALRRTARAVRAVGLNPTSSFTAAAAPWAARSRRSPQPGNADPRFRELFTTWRQLDQLEQGVAAIPSAHPINGAINFTSGYGVRSDPFRGRAAMHAGIDLAGPLGTPIYATADGIVGRAE